MAIPVIMPKQGQSVETCIITQWFRKKGDKISAGDLLFSYETDKAAFELESPATGRLLDIFFYEGAEVPVLVNVAVIGEPGESTTSFRPGGETTRSSADTSKMTSDTIQESKPADKPVSFNAPAAMIRISPRAKKLAADKNIDYISLQGSGPNGRIVVSDIEKALVSGVIPSMNKKSSSGEFTDIPVSNVRKLIAKAMHSSLQNSAQLTHHMSADARNILNSRQKIKDGIRTGSENQDITLNDMICWCVIRALDKHPDANCHFLGESIRQFSCIHLGIAVDTPRGLMVPAVKNADQMTLQQLSKELKKAAEYCRKGNINPELIQSTSASFTVSNLGNYGVEVFTPIINLPQVAILGVCTIVNRPADLGNNTFGFVPYIGLSLTYDHRAIDGGPATLFLKEIREQIENFK